MNDRGSVQITRKGDRLVLENRQWTLDYGLGDGCWNLAWSRGGSFRGMRLFARAEVNGRWVETWGHPVERWGKEDFVDALGEGMKVEFVHRAGEEPVELTLILRMYRERPSLLLELCIKNRTGERLRIGEIRPLEVVAPRGGSLYLGEGLDTAKIYRESNNLCASVVRDLKDTGTDGREPGNPFVAAKETGNLPECVHRSGWLGLLFNPLSRTAFLGGFVTVETALGRTVTRYQPEKGITQWYAACMYDGWEIEPGKELVSERFYLDVRSDPFRSLETFAEVIVAENNLSPMQETPALWCSWYPYRLKLTEEEVLKNAEVIAKHFRDYGVKVMQLDYGWNHKDTPGDWSHNEERFPHGLKWLVEQLASMGLELGLWIAPFIVFEGSEFFQKHPECAIRDDQENPSAWKTPWPWEPKQNIYDLDLRNPVTQAFIADVFRGLASLGIKYFKMDFLNGPSTAPMSFTAGIRNEDRVRDGERVRIGLSVIRKAVGDGAYLLGCNLPHSHALGIVSAVFDAMDVGNAYFDREEGWAHFRRRTSGLMARYYQQKRCWHNDPDVIYVGGNPPEFSPICSMGEARLRTTAVALSGGPVLLGDNLTELPEERLRMYTLCLPAYGVSARPVDLFTRDYPRIWNLKVEADWGKWDVVGLFNYENQAVSIPVDFTDLGLHSEKPYLVWEFWEGTFLGIHSHYVDVNVPARNVCVVLLKEVPQVPTLLSTSFHVSQGGVEVSEVKWDGRRRVLSGVCHRVPGARGDLIFYVPEGFEGMECTTDGERLPAQALVPNIWKVGLEFAGQAIHWQIRFHKTRPE